LRNLRYFRKGEKHGDGHSEINWRDRDWEYAYRERWQHDKIVRSNWPTVNSDSTAKDPPGVARRVTQARTRETTNPRVPLEAW